MKNVIRYSLLLVFAVSICNAQVPTYTITSSIENMKSKTMNLTIWNGSSETVSKRNIELVDGQIYYTDTTSKPLMLRITIQDSSLIKRVRGGYFPVASQHIWTVILPGETVSLRGHLSDFAEVYPYGNFENDILRGFTQQYFPLLNQSVNISVDLANKEYGANEKKIKDEKQKQEVINKNANAILLEFLERNPSSISGLYFLGDSFIRKRVNFGKLSALLDKVDSKHQNTAFFQSLYARVVGEKYKEGAKIFEIVSTRTLDGQKFTASDWKGQFYLIDFWGSWCMPCLNDVPFLKEFKENLKDKVKVLGIASDKDDKWRKAITDHQLDWQHILIGPGDQDFSTRLNVTGYPTKILVDPEGKIVYRSSGGGKDSFDKMTTIIKSYNN